MCVCVCVGEPVQCTAWAGQCALYILIMMFEKVLIILVLLIPQWKKVSRGSILGRVQTYDHFSSDHFVSVQLYYPCGKCMNSNSKVNFVCCFNLVVLMFVFPVLFVVLICVSVYHSWLS